MSKSALTWFLEEWSPEKKYTELQICKMRCFEAVAVISFCRPFGSSRSRTVLSRKRIGVTFTPDEKVLFDKLMWARDKYIAHSDEEEMHFRVDVFQSRASKLYLPNMTFDYGLLLDEDEYYDMQDLLSRLSDAVYETILNFTEKYPEEIKMYKNPPATGPRIE